ncbi:MAG TPA: efflux RND transporter permease subunit [Kiritimatiellia bacterium]|nr:efflux RND transporter permease subunit [Kiritimatiellia bacterium]
MFLANASTRRPVAMSCMLIALIALGLNTWRKLSLEFLPSIDIPYITITTTWLGASPEDMEKDVAKHIEDAVSGLEGLKHIYSPCQENVSLVVLEFEMGVDVNVAADDVREKLDAVLPDLPDTADRPIIEKVDINAVPVANMFLTGDISVDELYDYADNTLDDRFSTVRGVEKIELTGGNEREVWVELDRDKVVAAGLTSWDIVAALRGSIVNVPGGRIREAGSEYNVRFYGEYDTVEEIETLEVATRDGRRRTLKDLGTVRVAPEEVRERSFLDGRQGIAMRIVKKSEGNTVSVVKESRKRYEEVIKTLPPGMELIWVDDDARNVQASVDATIDDIFSGILLCAAILFLFLVNIRATFVVALAMPVTIIISLFFMGLAGYTLNQSTLLAIGLSVGILVSNSIVVLENVVKRFDDIPDRWEAARVGTSEVAVAVLASAGTNVVVMIPIAMMSSMVGRFFAPFAGTTLIVNCASILVSFTLTPILCALIMRPASQRKQNWATRLGGRWVDFVQRYGRLHAVVLRRIIERRWLAALIVLGGILLFVGTWKFCGKDISMGFAENNDYGKIFVRMEFPPYYDLEHTAERVSEIEKLFEPLQDRVRTFSLVGRAEAFSGQANQGVYLAMMILLFKDKTDRDWSIFERVDEVRELLAHETDVIATAAVPTSTGGAQSLQLDMVLKGDDLEVLDQTALNIHKRFLEVDGVGILDATVRDPKREVRVLPKRAVMADMGVTPEMLAWTVRANVEGIESADFKKGDRTYDIRVKFDEVPGREQVREFLLPTKDGQAVTLETVADVRDALMKIMIYRHDKQRAVKIVGDISHGAKLGDVRDSLMQTAHDENLLPPGYTLEFAGLSEEMSTAMVDFAEAAIIAAFLTVLTLAAMLESFRRMFLVLTTLPMGLIGVMWALYLTGYSASIFVQLGVVMLIGVVVNPAILIADKLGQNLNAGMAPHRALREAMSSEFRAVLMVILASGIGMIPLATGTGIGSENRVGIGVASVGGIFMAGILTLTLLPVTYALFTGWRRKWRAK